MSKTELVISFEVDGLHSWPDAPDKYKEFRQIHRHLFKVICFLPTVESNDPTRREVELWSLRQNVIQFLKSEFGEEPINFKTMSCEGISDYLKEHWNFSSVFVGEEWFLGAMVS